MLGLMGRTSGGRVAHATDRPMIALFAPFEKPLGWLPEPAREAPTANEAPSTMATPIAIRPDARSVTLAVLPTSSPWRGTPLYVIVRLCASRTRELAGSRSRRLGTRAAG
jgi:hypothetical protein